MSMSLRQLEYFAALAERLSFREAADDCFVTQPGLSAQLKDLERLLGVQLFERSQRTVLLTPPERPYYRSRAAFSRQATNSLTWPAA